MEVFSCYFRECWGIPYRRGGVCQEGEGVKEVLGWEGELVVMVFQLGEGECVRGLRW